MTAEVRTRSMGDDESFASSSSIRKMAGGVAVFFGVCAVGALGYMLAGWSFNDAVYMVIITIFGVGFEEVQPVTSIPLRTLTILVIIIGYGAVIYTVGGFIQLVIDGELNRFMGARRMTRDIDQMNGHTIVCGMGRMGQHLCRELQAQSRPFVVVDGKAEVVQRAGDLGFLALQGDASDEETLRRAGIDRASVLATVLPDDATNVFITLTAKSMNADLLIVARAENPRTEPKLAACGADRVVMPTTIGASKISQIILRPTAEELLDRLNGGAADAIDVMSFGLELDQIVIDAHSPFAGKSLGELEVRGAHGYLVVGVRHANGETVLHPAVDTHLGVGDTVVLLGYEDDILEIEPRLRPASEGSTSVQ
ncbi:MAG: potassium channel protein [Actinomycetota bacterium]